MTSCNTVRGRSKKEAERRHSQAAGVMTGLVLMALGTMFILDGMGRFDAGRIWDWWPLILIGIGLTDLLAPRSDAEVAWGIAFLAGGGYFLARELDWVDWRFREVWPFLFVLAGVALVMRALASRRPSEPEAPASLPENGGVR
jgi:hypothetical protein